MRPPPVTGTSSLRISRRTSSIWVRGASTISELVRSSVMMRTLPRSPAGRAVGVGVAWALLRRDVRRRLVAAAELTSAPKMSAIWLAMVAASAYSTRITVSSSR